MTPLRKGCHSFRRVIAIEGGALFEMPNYDPPPFIVARKLQWITLLIITPPFRKRDFREIPATGDAQIRTPPFPKRDFPEMCISRCEIVFIHPGVLNEILGDFRRCEMRDVACQIVFILCGSLNEIFPEMCISR